MKRNILILLAALALVMISCKEETPFTVDPNDMISIRPAEGVQVRSAASLFRSAAAVDSIHLSALEIVKQTTLICIPQGERSFAPEQRDTIAPRLLMWATDVISLDGALQTDWIEAHDVVLVHYINGDYRNRDTIAYIPNSVLRTAETAIKAAYEAKDIEACYNLFNTAYTFVPITGAEWRALKEAGQQ